MKVKIIFANIMQCVLHYGFNGKKENISGGFHPEKYIEYFTKEEPDIYVWQNVLWIMIREQASLLRNYQKNAICRIIKVYPVKKLGW